MRDLTVELLHKVLGGRLRMATLPPRDGEATLVRQVVTDSRRVEPGDVFWALPGQNGDGALFVEDAFDRGASGAVVSGRYVQPRPGCWCLEVEDAQQSLNQLAVWNRARFGGHVIGVTGSVGKTTAREMIYSVLRTQRAGTASPKNFNNHVGVPLSILAMEPDDDFAVLELAASAAGEISALAAICQPSIGVITRVGEAHLAGFGSQQGVAHAKGELLTQLPPGGWAVLAGDDPWLRRAAQQCTAHVIWVGRSLDCDVVATRVQSSRGQLRFHVDRQPYIVPVWGRHHLTAALSAVAVGKIFGLSHEDIAAGLASFKAPAMRCQIAQAAGTTIINDTYNASPTAMRAALELLRDFDAAGRRVVVLGDMRELGEAAGELHRRLGDEVVTLCGADLLVACGDHAQDVVAGARDAGMPSSQTHACRLPQETLSHLGAALRPGDVVLVKGSRALAMERVVESLEAHARGTQPGGPPERQAA